MKKIVALLTAAALVLGVGMVIHAQNTRMDDKEAKIEVRDLASSQTFKDQDLIGLRVENLQEEDLGRITSLAIDANNGRVAFGVVGYGGFWGWGSKYVAVPLAAMSLKVRDDNGKPDKFVLNMKRADFSKAPTFSGNGWPDRKQAGESYRFFGQAPYWTETTTHGSIEIKIGGK